MVNRDPAKDPEPAPKGVETAAHDLVAEVPTDPKGHGTHLQEGMGATQNLPKDNLATSCLKQVSASTERAANSLTTPRC